MAEIDRLERLTDLVMVLLESRRPLTLDEIAREVPGYPEGPAARRQAFERDKRLLREEGIPVAAEALTGPEQFGYRIHPDAYYLPDLELTPDEQQALRIAVAGVHLGDTSGHDALLKLGAAPATVSSPLASLPRPGPLDQLFEAVRRRARCSFSYRSSPREVSPAGLWFRRGRWYLGAFDHAALAQRTFRADRIEGEVTLGAPGSAEVPEEVAGALSAPEPVPWTFGEGEEERVSVQVDAVEAGRVIGVVGEAAVRAKRPDGSAIVELTVTNPEALRSWVLGLLDHAEVLEPERARQKVAAWLAETARRPPATGGPPAVTPAPSQRSGGRPDARLRLRRLLAMMGWLAQVGVAPLSEVARRFSMSEAEVVRELELAACCGVPPYTPDTLMEIAITGEQVEARLPAELGQPRRLTAAEGLGLLTAARTIVAVEGSDPTGPLGRAVGKLEAALGQVGPVVELEEPEHLAEVRAAVEAGRLLSFSYYSASSDRLSTRRVAPLQLAAIDGRWYLDAFDEQLAEPRRFRLDRLFDLEVLGPAPHRPEAAMDAATAFVPPPDAVTARLAVTSEGAWVLDSVPVEGVVELPDGGFECVLFVAGRAWLERLLLQLGPNGQVLWPPELQRVGPEAAARLAARYEGPPRNAHESEGARR